MAMQSSFFKIIVYFIVSFALGYAQPISVFPLDELEPGLSGYALTAGAENVLERFDVEILALQYDIGLGFPVILVKASGSFIEQTGGVAAGMSGSPVYIPLPRGDQLLGAIGYTFPQSDHSLALVTPFEVMQRTIPERPLETLLGDAPAPFGPDLSNFGQQEAIKTPLLIAGLSSRASDLLAPLLSSGFTAPLPMQSSRSFASQDLEFDLQPGSPISVQLARGDVTIAAVGTLTALQDDKFWAFGHPFFSHGDVRFALAPAYVNYIVPSDIVPFKLADSGQRNLGTVTQDRPYAISGIVDIEPGFLPVTLTLNGAAGSHSKRFEVSADERYFAPIIAAASLQILDEVNESVRGGTADVAWEIKLAGNDTLNLLEQTYHEGDIAAATATLVAEPFEILAENIYKSANIEAVNIVLSLDPEPRFASIARVVVDNERIMVGEDIVTFVRLQPYRQGPEVKTVRFNLPEELQGEVELIFRGGLEPSETEEDDDERPIFTFEELLVALRDNVQASELIVETLIDGDMERLTRLSLPYLIEGSETVTITIESELVQTEAILEDNPEQGADVSDEADPESEEP